MLFGKKITSGAHELAIAVADRNEAGFGKAMRNIVKAMPQASPAEIQEAIMILLPVVESIPLGPGAQLAQLVGGLADKGTDPLAVLPVLVDRAAGAMEEAAGLLAAYEQLEVEPGTDDAQAAIERLTAAAPHLGLSDEDPYRLAEAWYAGGDWVQPTLFLCQRKDVRQALPQRERLTRAIEPVREHIETAHWLHGLLMVLDDEPVIVLHRETGRGFRLRISGIGDNFQLHTLLAAHLIGDLTEGLLPGLRPSAAEVAAATDGDLTPPGGMSGRFNLVDAQGKWIWNEGTPADIPVFDGVRVIVLDPPPYERRWNAGRSYPLMTPEVFIDEHLTADDAASLLGKVRPSAAHQPAGQPSEVVVTDDLSIPLPPDRTVAEVVDLVFQSVLAGEPVGEVDRLLTAEFGLSPEDAQLARDRALGGLVRAASGNPQNCPPPDKDPVAWESFQRGTRDPALVARIYPDLTSRH